MLDTLVKRSPEYEISALLRTVPEDFGAIYPHVKVIKGTYDDHDILHKAAGEADVVVRTSLPLIVASWRTKNTDK